MFFFINLVTILSFFYNLSSFNYLAFSVSALGLYIGFCSKVLYFPCCGLLGNFGYFYLAYYLAIFFIKYRLVFLRYSPLWIFKVMVLNLSFL